jgi:hypothetical protein
MRDSSQFGIQEMAKFLEVRKSSNHPTVLLLGARIGRLFHCAPFYENLQLFSNRDFNQLSPVMQFQECYAILTSDKFSETDLHSLLLSSLHNVTVARADINLASLIKGEYFDEIISTNIDDALEEALLQRDMKYGRDYEIMSIGRNQPHYERSSRRLRIIKPFGDLVSKDYTVSGRPAHLEDSRPKSFLQSLLGKDLLIVGVDPIWDQDLLRIIPVKAEGAMWLVSEEEDIVEKSSSLSNIMRAKQRRTNHILGPEGNYEFFVLKLHDYLYRNLPPNYPLAQSQMLQNLHNQIEQIIGTLPEIAVQLKSLTAMLCSAHEKMQALQNDQQTFLADFQKIKQDLEEIKKQQRNC